jgi:hypothetical protein
MEGGTIGVDREREEEMTHEGGFGVDVVDLCFSLLLCLVCFFFLPIALLHFTSNYISYYIHLLTHSGA